MISHDEASQIISMKSQKKSGHLNFKFETKTAKEQHSLNEMCRIFSISLFWIFSPYYPLEAKKKKYMLPVFAVSLMTITTIVMKKHGVRRARSDTILSSSLPMILPKEISETSLIQC